MNLWGWLVGHLRKASLTSLQSPPSKLTCPLSLAPRVLRWLLHSWTLGHPSWLEERSRETRGPFCSRREGELLGAIGCQPPPALLGGPVPWSTHQDEDGGSLLTNLWADGLIQRHHMNSSHLRQDSPAKAYSLLGGWVGRWGPVGLLSRVPNLVWGRGMELGPEGHSGPHPPPPLTVPDLKEAF